MPALAVPFRYAIVEDERLSKLFLKESLKKLAPLAELVWEAENGDTAFSFLQHVKVDVIFLDVYFPPDDAFGLLMRTKEAGIPLPQLIFISAYTEPALKAFEWAAKDYLVKPITPERLLQTLDRIYLKLTSERNEVELTKLSTLDALTGIFNRAYFNKQMAYELNRYRRYNRMCTLIMVDIDFFKHINDTYGHLAGDKALTLFATTIAAQLRKTDVVCRLGGEEFAIILPEIDAKGALVFAERLRLLVEDLKLEFEEMPIHFTASFGVTQFHPNDSCLESIVRRADAALYEAKNNGRNRVCVHLLEENES
jgi:diguanylate cyclase (GGDEF)-like protein